MDAAVYTARVSQGTRRYFPSFIIQFTDFFRWFFKELDGKLKKGAKAPP
jgi:hypothetical protein